MLVPAIRRCSPCNLRRIAACVTYRNKMRTTFAWQCNGNCCRKSSLLSTSSANLAACRMYSTEPDSETRPSLPMLVNGAELFSPSIFVPFRLFFLSFNAIPSIDKDFVLSETLDGAKHAITVISKALANKDYESLEGLVAEDMIDVLRPKIETLSPEQRWLIAVREEDVVFQVLSDITTTAKDEERSIEIKVVCHYIPEMAERTKTLETTSIFTDMSKLGFLLVCNYTFTRKYVNNVGGSWIATFVNHYSINMT